MTEQQDQYEEQCEGCRSKGEAPGLPKKRREKGWGSMVMVVAGGSPFLLQLNLEGRYSGLRCLW